MRRALLITAALLPLAGCNLAPHAATPALPTPQQWPQGAAYGPLEEGSPALPWRQVAGDARLVKVIEMALSSSRSLREQVAALAEARAQYHIQRAALLPTVDASASGSVTRGIANQANNADSYSVSAGASSFEIDLFGRLRNEAKASFESYLASQSGLKSTRLSLVSDVATAWLTYAADKDTLTAAEGTLDSARKTLELERGLFKSGLASGSDVASAIATVEGAASDVAADITTLAQDRNALDLLVGAHVADELLPDTLDGLDHAISAPPAGLPSEVLRQRPDVVEAEHTLKGTYATIGAARAAFFPAITLTSSVGLASTALSQLFTHGAAQWNVAPSASVPLLGGTTGANLAYAKAQRDYALAAYELAVQTAFRDVANALARRGTIADQRAAQDKQMLAYRRAWELADGQRRAGTGTYLAALVAQRSYYSAQQTRITAQLADLSNRFTLYAAVGADPSL
ncbi:MAG TPA: efflux transporter outer membrane subunit [Novosphingobium sp.]|nr:efflux transporter outer membrane subunit [Novosphingobium sp.]